ncbi:MAG: hypothetical protein OXG72_08400, partial [Acidobacteria bacterium]|nr:hypothetical protein [Acidobacteriota bacterium]
MAWWPFGRSRGAEKRSEDFAATLYGYGTPAHHARTVSGGLAAVEACCLAYRRATEAARVDGPARAVGAVWNALGQIGDDAARPGQYVAL